MSEYETDPEEYTLERTITFFSIGEHTHCSKALSRYVAEQLKRIAELEAVVGVAKEYEKMFARSRTKPYSVSNELQALFDALASLENNDEPL